MKRVKSCPCPHPDCPNSGSSARVIKAGKDKRGRQRFRCKGCGHYFSATKGTLFYRLRNSQKDLLEALAMLAERNSLAGQGGDSSALVGEGWPPRAASRGVLAAGLSRLTIAVGRTVDLRAEQRGKRGYRETEETGEFWKATAFDPQSKLRVARAVGKRDQELLEGLLEQVSQRVEEVPALTSDQLPGYEEAVVGVFGEVPPYCGRGRPPTKKHPISQLRYGQVVKQRERGRVVAVSERIIFGEAAQTRAALGG